MTSTAPPPEGAEAGTKSSRSLMRFARQATWLHFVVAGGLLFLLDALRTPLHEDTILLTREIADGLARTREELTGKPVSQDERSAVIAAYIGDEILLREAYTRELHRRDGLVRKRLLELMRFLFVEEPQEPTEEDLRRYLAAHVDVYQTPAAVTLSQVYFSSDEEATSGDSLLNQLRAGIDFRRLGEPFWLGQRLEGYVEPQLVQFFGPDYARRIFELPLGQWSGPIRSTRGIHFVRVEERRPPELPTFEELMPVLKPDWLAARREELLQRKIDELRGKYRVEIEPGVEP
jgi:hypothetical protein